MEERIVETLATPLFLVAMPQVQDPFFHRSVILLLEHSVEGSFGLVVNRITELPLAAILSELEIEWKGPGDSFAFFGGPVHPNVGTALFSEPPFALDPEQMIEVGQGVVLSQDIRVLRQIGATPPQQFRLILGSAGWTAGQLEAELSRNDWLIAPFEGDVIFAWSEREMWERVLDSIGIRPESLPTWTGGDRGQAN
jgi:putative transcriptional regulator